MSQNRPPIEDLGAHISWLLDSLDPNTSVAVAEFYKVDAAKESIFVQNADVLVEVSRKLPGCRMFTLNKAVTAGVTGPEYLIYKEWQGRDSFRDHWNSPSLQHFQYTVTPLILVPPDVRFYVGPRDQSQIHSSAAPADVCSSALGFSWAMSLFAAQQMSGFFSSGSAKSFQNLKVAAEGELSQPFRAALRAGDTLQRGMLDIVQSGLGGQIFDPAQWMRLFTNIIQSSVRPAVQRQERAPAQQYKGPPAPDVGRPRFQPTHQPVSGTYPLSRSSGSWGPMPPVSASDPAPPPQSASETPSIAEPDICGSFPFEPHYVDVYGSRMHYIEAGGSSVWHLADSTEEESDCGSNANNASETILLLHGNPSWSYGWRNIIPHLTSWGRCIAPDLIGYGKSDKPDLEYMWFDHVRYLEKFIETMRLRNIILVLHDQGSALGLHYAMRHQNNVKAIAFFEALVRPFTWEDFSTPQFREIFRQFRTGGKGGLGWKMIVEQNLFIEQLLPQASGRQLSEMEMNYYREPFKYQPSRLPIWRFPRQTAIGGEPEDVWDAVTEYSQKLQTSRLPKLMLYATPGALLTQEHVEWCKQNINNLKSVDVGPGIHFLEESSPHRIGREIATWIRSLTASPEKEV